MSWLHAGCHVNTLLINHTLVGGVHIYAVFMMMELVKKSASEVHPSMVHFHTPLPPQLPPAHLLSSVTPVLTQSLFHCPESANSHSNIEVK